MCHHEVYEKKIKKEKSVTQETSSMRKKESKELDRFLSAFLPLCTVVVSFITA